MRFLKTAKEYNIISGLPKDFTEVEYIQSTGTQYIDTGFKPNNNTTLDMVASFIRPCTIATARWSGSPTYDTFGFFVSNSSTENYAFIAYWGKYSTNQWTKFYGYTNNTKIRIVLSPTKVIAKYIDSTSFDNEADIVQETYQSTYNLYLCGSSNNGSPLTQGSCTIYSTKIYDNGVLIRDYIPCLDKNNIPCLFDKVEGKPYYNAGTGEFNYGAKIYPVEYIENLQTGSSRNWINTGIVTDNTTKWEVKISYNDTNTGKLMGSGFGGDTRFNLGIESSRFRFGFGSGWFDANSQIYTPDTEPHIWVLDCLTKTGTIDGYSAISPSTFGTNTYPIALFGRTNNVGSTESSNTIIGKIYYSKIWKNNILVSDMIPVRDENNVGYMFNKVTHTLYANSGSGSFTIGNDIPQYKKKYTVLFPKENPKDIPAGFTEVEYLESSGEQYIETGYNIVTSTDEVEMTYQLMDGETKYKWFFGEHDANARFGLGSGDGTNKRNVAYGTGTTQIADTYFLNKPHIYKASTAGVYVDDEKKVNYSSFSSTSTLWLFSLNLSGGTYFANARIYRYSHKRNDALLLDMIPCLDTYGRPCMYDRVSKNAYYNQGTGDDFTYGPKIQPVEYLESTGTQYIDTGVIPTNTHGHYVEMSYNTVNNSVTFGTMISGNGVVGPYYASASTNVGWWIRWGNNEYKTTAPTPTVGTKYKMYLNYMNDRKSKVDDIIITDTLASFSTVNYPTMTLFRRNYSTAYAYLDGKIYKYQITNGTELIRDMIPVKDENNVGYMFDKITHTLYGNSGTGEFICGKGLTLKSRMLLDDNSIPKGYMPAKYLQSTGTQYIDTGLKGKPGYDFDYKFNSIIDDNAYGIGGEWENQKSCYLGVIRNNNKFAYHYKDTQSPVEVQTLVNNTDYEVQVHLYTGEQYYVINGTKSTVGTISGTFTSSVNMCLFAVNSTSTKTFSKLKMYFCKIWDNGTLVRDYIPVIRMSDNKPGMWDKVNKVFYINQATSGNDFIVGF